MEVNIMLHTVSDGKSVVKKEKRISMNYTRKKMEFRLENKWNLEKFKKWISQVPISGPNAGKGMTHGRVRSRFYRQRNISC